MASKIGIPYFGPCGGNGVSVLITIITINYNHAMGLARTLNSVSVQDVVENVQHIIVDGGSTDGSKDIAAAYVDKHNNTLLISETDSGIYNAMNKGLALAKNKYVGFLNSGDVLFDNQCLKKVSDLIESEDDIDVIYSDIVFTDRSGRISRVWRPGSFARWKLFLGWMPPHPLTLVSTETVRSHCGFNEKFFISADYDLMLRILLEPNRKIRYLGETMVEMETGGLSNGSIRSILSANLEVIKSWIDLRGSFFPFWIFITKPLYKIFQIRI